MLEGSPRRLPFTFNALGATGRLALADLVVGPVVVDRLELEVADLGTDPGGGVAERFQRRRTRLRSLAVRITPAALEERAAGIKRHLAGLGVTQLSTRLSDGFVSLRARATDGLAAADLSFRIQLVNTGAQLRALASSVRVHGALPTPGPVIADRILVALLGATDVPGVVDRPHARGLCDIEIDLIGGLLWQLMPPSGWRLPAISELELVQIKIARSAIEVGYAPAGSRTGDLGVRPQAHQLAAAHDLMHSVDQQLRDGHLEDAMRGYRALLAAGGPDQPLLLERILALASARPAWFFDGLELSRQALGRWPQFPPAHAALASITLAQGDAREAASHLTQLAQLASADGDDDQAALAALAGARLLRVLEPKSATQLYQLALEHDPGSAEAADSLVDRLADEQRWPELVRLVRARTAITSDPGRVVAARLRLADVLVHHLGDSAGAQAELAAARELAPDDPAIYEMTARILEASDRPGAIAAWRAVARLSELRNDHRTCARAHAQVALLLPPAEALVAWQKALELDPLQAEAIAGLAAAAAVRGDHAVAAELYERLRGLGLPQQIAARYELALARSLVSIGRTDDARGSLRRATVSGGETAAEAHAVLAEIADATFDREHAAAELDTAIGSLVDLASSSSLQEPRDSDRLYARAAQLAVARASLLDRTGHAAAATSDWARAHMLAQEHAPEIARDAARTMLDRSEEGVTERRWIDAVLATRPPGPERASLLVRRADVRRKERSPDLAAALADLHEALALTEEDTPELAVTRRRAYTLEAELLQTSGDRRARAQALASLARMSERAGDRVAVEAAAAAAWLDADEPAAALPHGARAHAAMDLGDRPDVPAALRREVLVTLGEAAWRQRAWPDVIRAYRALTEDKNAETARLGTYRYRLAVAADRTGDAVLAMTALRPLADGDDASGTTPENRAQALRLFADLAERAGDLAGAAHALEGFASLAVDGAASARADAMYRAGELFRRAERTDDAIRCLEAALRISDTHLPALDALELAWRERGDLERVSVILGRKVAATSRHPQRQKPLLSRLGDLQDQLDRPDVALAAHQRALEIDPGWRPSLRYVTKRLGDAGDLVAAVGGYAQLAGELAGDLGADGQLVLRERQAAAMQLAELVMSLPEPQLDSIRDIAMPTFERVALSLPDVGGALGRLRGERAPVPPGTPEEATQSGRSGPTNGSPRSLRDGAARALAQGKVDEAFATLETANHVSPGDPVVLRELVELALQLGDHGAAARHLSDLAGLAAGARKGDILLELADVLYDRVGDAPRAREAMQAAADAFGSGSRRDATLRMLANEAGTHLAWNIAVTALSAITAERQTAPDVLALATALVRAGRDADGIALLEEAARTKKLDAPELLHQLRAEVARKSGIAAGLDARAEMSISPVDAEQMRLEAREIRAAIRESDIIHEVSIQVTATPAEAESVLALAAASADREQLIAAWRRQPDDPGLLLAVLAHLGDREPALRRQILDEASGTGTGRARAVALHELAELARRDREPVRALALWLQAHEVDATFAPVWMPLADGLAAADDLDAARHFYLQVAASDAYAIERRAWAKERAETLGIDHTIVSGEIRQRPRMSKQLARAIELAEADDLPGAIAAAQSAAEAAAPTDMAALELLERLYLETGDITAASEAIGRQLVVVEQPLQRASLWRRRARLYRDSLGRDAEAYRCLKEAHACSPADPEIAYQLRTAAMVRGEWGLVASLLYREIASATHPRDRGALHLELALIYGERLADEGQAQVNFEQALAFDPTIPAAKLPLAKRYEAIGRHAEAAKLFDDAASAARAADRAGLLEAAARCRRAAEATAASGDLPLQLERADAAGELATALDLAHQVWRAQPGHALAFRVLAASHRTNGDLGSLTEITTVRASRADQDADRATMWLDVARLADETGAVDQAARAYDLALIADPGHVGALDARGALAFRQRDFATADLIYRDLGRGESVLGDDELALRRSIIAQELGRDSDALALANTAAAIAPNRRDILARVQELATRTGDLPAAIVAARGVLELVPLEDEETQIITHFALVDLLRAAGDLDGAAKQLQRIVRDHPHHNRALEQLAEVHVARNDWPTATRYLYQLVPLAHSAAERADRLFRLGEAVLVHLGDVDRADDVFLRASDLDPGHVPTLRRLLDVYWRADDPGGLVEVAGELAGAGALSHGSASDASLAQALIAAALVGDTVLAGKLGAALGDEAPRRIVAALGELEHRDGRLQLATAGVAVVELARRGLLDLGKVRSAAAGTPVESALQS